MMKPFMYFQKPEKKLEFFCLFGCIRLPNMRVVNDDSSCLRSDGIFCLFLHQHLVHWYSFISLFKLGALCVKYFVCVKRLKLRKDWMEKKMHEKILDRNFWWNVCKHLCEWLGKSLADLDVILKVVAGDDLEIYFYFYWVLCKCLLLARLTPA